MSSLTTRRQLYDSSYYIRVAHTAYRVKCTYTLKSNAIRHPQRSTIVNERDGDEKVPPVACGLFSVSVSGS